MANRNKQILVIGSVNVDHVMQMQRLPQPGETVAGRHYDIVGGGKGANQAVACGRLGGNTRFIANVGSDAFGVSMVEEFAKDGIDISRIRIIKSEKTGVALIFVDEQAENVIGIAGGANSMLSPEQIRENEDAIAQASYLLLQLEIPLKSITAAVNIARKHQTEVMLNPAPACPLSDDLLACVDIITPNQSETELLTGIAVTDEHSARKAAAVLHDREIETVIITMGAVGAYISTNETSELVPGVKTIPVDTTAAGDTFNGAFLVGLSNGLSPANAVRFANQCASIAVTRAGAQPSIPYLSEVQQFLRSENH